MVRNVCVDAMDGVTSPVIAVGNNYPDGYIIASHQHRRGQLIFSTSGAVVLATPHGRWIMPPQRGMWIPPGTMHDVRMLGKVNIQSIFLEPEAAQDMPVCCHVVSMSPFLRSLITEALDVPVPYDPNSRAGALMALIQHEMRQLPVLPLSLSFPGHTLLAERCDQFLRAPTVHATIEEWSARLGMSRRTFTRLFRRETGMTFVGWRQQACLVAALPRLVAGESVTSIALDLGYDNPAAFTTMFKRVLGSSPRLYLSPNA